MTKTEAKEILLFILNSGYYSQLSAHTILEAIKKHLQYGTVIILRNRKEEIVAIARWNWLDEETVHILDVIIKKEYRRLKTLKQLTALGFYNNPRCKKIIYKRGKKYPYRKPKIYTTKQLRRR